MGGAIVESVVMFLVVAVGAGLIYSAVDTKPAAGRAGRMFRVQVGVVLVFLAVRLQIVLWLMAAGVDL